MPFNLHVLSTPPAFILSQNQTLHKKTMENPKQTLKKDETFNTEKSHAQKTMAPINPTKGPNHTPHGTKPTGSTARQAPHWQNH